MPIEIKELLVKITITDNKSPKNTQNGGALSSFNKEAIIKECVEKVLEILENKKER